ncbi:DUF2905 domain-containing protein [Alkalicoccus saliphilus]|jgi:hypothetical protein|uniref:DUF2905 domain-containing protein n=1 Tax=Alkalicoccus saliphilus TaxID=200989 RepID=UPI00157CB4CC|nr:DUF2905 domain-containing protein [Alkalicoccus saliphilus]
MSIPKLLITTGAVLIIAGVLWQVGGRFFSLGRLPGDIVIERGGSTFYFPVMTSIIISIVLSLIFMLIRR